MRSMLFAACAAVFPLAAQSLETGVDPRIELFAILFRLAGAVEYSAGTIPRYNEATDTYFAPFREHEAVAIAREVRQRRYIAYDAVMSLAIHTDRVPELNERIPLDWPGRALDARWQPADARRMIEAARRFAVDTDFLRFMEEQGEISTVANARMRTLIEEHVRVSWFEQFYGKPPGASLRVVPGLSNGSSSYGPRFLSPDGLEELYAIIGIFSTDSNGLPQFSPGIATTIVHEFSHSFVNPAVDKIAADATPSADTVLRFVFEPMRAQGYATGIVLLYESLVRACSARYVLATSGVDAGLDAVRYEQERSFYWTERLYHLLGEYEADRERYPDMDSFLPRILEFFRQLPDEVEGIIEGYKAARPRVVSSTPAQGDTGVDPGLTQIQVRFDRPMRNSWSVFRVPGKDFPQAIRASYDESRTVFTLEVSMQPGRTYALSFNNEGTGNFMTEERMRISPFVLAFSTRGE